MSWEGYVQTLCKAGHPGSEDAYFFDPENPEYYYNCSSPGCYEPLAWYNYVDTTNGSFDVDAEGDETEKRIDGYIELEKDKEAEECTCDKCGIKHIKKYATFKIPKGGHLVQKTFKDASAKNI